MLRDPVERVLSHYYSHIHFKKKCDGGVMFTSLEEALDSFLPEVCNLSTRFLCLDTDAVLGNEHLEQAQRTLDRCFFVGIQERFEESVILLHRAMLFDRIAPYGERRHANDTRPDATSISMECRSAIEAANHLDCLLYDYGRKLFGKELASLGDISAELLMLRRLSARALGEYEEELSAATEWLHGFVPEGASIAADELQAAAASIGMRHRPFKQAVRNMRLSGALVVSNAEHGGIVRVDRAAVGLVPLRDISRPILRHLALDEARISVPLRPTDDVV